MFTIIIPCYNVEVFISFFIDALQRVRQIEKVFIIFIDDASTDNTPQIIENVLLKFKYAKLIRNKKNLAQGGALNKAIRQLETHWYFRLDPDDLPNENFVEEILAKLDDQVGLIRYKFNFIKSNKIVRPNALESLYFRMAFGWSMGINTTKFGIPIFKENFKMEDMEMFGRQYTGGYKEVFINKSLVNYRVDNESSTMNTLTKQKMQNWKEAFDIYCANEYIRGWRTSLYKFNIRRKIKKMEKTIAITKVASSNIKY